MSDYDYHQMDRDLDRTKSKVFLRTDAAFFGPLLCSLHFKWDDTLEVPTAATDGESLWWHPGDFLRCRAEEQNEDVSTLMHELWHVADLHALRRGTRCPDKWNEACDIWINRMLKRDGYYIGKDWLLRPDLDKIEMIEDIYDILKKEGKPQSGPSKCQHDKMQDAFKKDAAVAAVVQAIQSAEMAGQPGSIPGHAKEMINKFLAPVIKWEDELSQWMNDLLEEDYTWTLPDRRYRDIYLPSMYQEDGLLDHLMYFEDVSGSITQQDNTRFNSELKYVWEQLKPKKMTVVQFDTIIQKVDEFNEGDSFDEIEVKGRGGTCLIEVRQMIIDQAPTAAIIFTDMGVTPMRPLPIDIPILWVAINTKKKGPFGKTIFIKT